MIILAIASETIEVDGRNMDVKRPVVGYFEP